MMEEWPDSRHRFGGFRVAGREQGLVLVPCKGGIQKILEYYISLRVFVSCLSFKHTFSLFHFVQFDVGCLLVTLHV